jgi:hypothetical protein
MSMLERLVSHLYSAFDTNPRERLALRIRHDSGAFWRIENGRITIGTEDLPDEPVLDMAIDGATIGDVASAAADAGFTIAYQDAELLSRAAAALRTGSGTQSESNGDHLYIYYDSLLWSLMDAFANGLEVAERDGIIAGLQQAYLHTAEGEWLDLWGSYFGIRREDGEDDAAYLHRTVAEVLRPRSNALAMEQTIKDLTGVDVYLREPWREIFMLDASTLSGAHRMQDGSFYTWTVFQPQVRQQISLAVRARILAIIERNRPAGVLSVHAFEQPMDEYIDLPWPPTLTNSRTVWRRVHADRRWRILSATLILSEDLPEPLVQFQFRYFGMFPVRARASTLSVAPARRWDQIGWGAEPWGRGHIPSEITIVS